VLAYLAAGQLDSVMDRGEVARHLVDSDECIFVENKTVEGIHPVHRARLLTCLKLSRRSIGFLNIFFAVFAVFAVYFFV
jgi:hypothetical protein